MPLFIESFNSNHEIGKMMNNPNVKQAITEVISIQPGIKAIFGYVMS